MYLSSSLIDKKCTWSRLCTFCCQKLQNMAPMLQSKLTHPEACQEQGGKRTRWKKKSNTCSNAQLSSHTTGRYVKKVDLWKGSWNPQRKTGVAMHFLEIISPESRQKCWHQHFSEKRRKAYFFTDFHKIRFKHRKANIFIKVLKLHGNWWHKNHSCCVFNNKIVATALLASLTAFLCFS